MKGIILAGGSGTRLYPVTFPTSKQLLPVYDKPMIYYPLSVLMQGDIREILIISTPHDLPRFQTLLADGTSLGLSLSYAEQEKPRGIAEAFIIAASFIGDESVALILGDNIFYGDLLNPLLMECSSLESGGVIFAYPVKDPKRYGVIALDAEKKVIDIIEKPKDPPSTYAVTGLYFYDHHVVQIAKNLKPSWRNELEITEVNRAYLAQGNLEVHLLDPSLTWLDTGTFDALHQASAYVQTMQKKTGVKIGCPEEIAYKKGWIDTNTLYCLAQKQNKSVYGRHLLDLLSLPLSNVKK